MATRRRRGPYIRGLSPASTRILREKKTSDRVPQHVIRLTEDVFKRWATLRSSLNLSTHSELAAKLIDQWEFMQIKASATRETASEILPSTSAGTSTPIQVRESLPFFEGVSDISEGIESESGESDIVKKYYKKAKETAGSFLNITLEYEEEEGTKKDRDVSYFPLMESDDIDDSDDEEFSEFSINMSLRQEVDVEASQIPTSAFGESFLMDTSDHDSGNDMIEEDEGEEIQAAEKQRDLTREKKIICFENELTQLVKLKVPSICDRKACKETVSLSKKFIGSALEMKWTCTKGHTVCGWKSQPNVRRTKAGDYLLAAAIVASGNNYEKIRLLFTFFGMGLISKNTFHQVQSKHITPVIKETFDNIIESNLQKYEGKNIVIAGDARMDSPGHSAQYCTYTLIEYDSKDILACEILDKRMTGLKSTAMEKEGLRRGLIKIIDSGIQVIEICTDASSSIASYIKKEYPQIKHSFDTWHGAKNLGKKLSTVASDKKSKGLREWIPDIINHFWYCSRKAEGSEDKLLARWRGALHHVTDTHEWLCGDDAIEPRCEHEPITDTEKSWLEPGGDAHVALTRIMLDVKLLHSLKHYVNFRHTGELETFHEQILMYAAKRFAYSYPIYKARNYLAAIDYEFHKDRPLLLTKDGNPRLHRAYSKRSKNWTCYQEKVPKSYTYINDLLNKIVTHFIQQDAPLRKKIEMSPTDPRRIKRTLAELTPPPTKSLFSEKKSRFKE